MVNDDVHLTPEVGARNHAQEAWVVSDPPAEQNLERRHTMHKISPDKAPPAAAVDNSSRLRTEVGERATSCLRCNGTPNRRSDRNPHDRGGK